MAIQDYELLLRIRADLGQALSGLDSLRKQVDATGSATDAIGVGGQRAAGGLDRMATSAGKAADNSRKLSDQSRKTEIDLRRLGEALVAAFAVDQMVEFGKKAVEVNLQYQQAFYTLQAATGSAEKSGKELEYVRGVAEQLGLEYLSTAQAYSRLVAAAKNSEPLRNSVHNIFEGVSQATTVLHLSADETQSVLLAIEQMMSKGRVQTQELVLQLGQRLPGAFELAAEALGTDTQQLTQWLEKGQIAADQFLPRFAAALQHAYGPSSQEAAKGLNAEINRLRNAVTDLYVEAGKDNMGPFTDSVRELTETLKDPATAEGFNLFISGLTKVAGWAVKATNSVSRFTKFIGEEIARRTGNFAVDDKAGIDQRIDELTQDNKKWTDYLNSWRSFGSRDSVKKMIDDNNAELKRLQALRATGQGLDNQKNSEKPVETITVTAKRDPFTPGAAKGDGKGRNDEYLRAGQDLIKQLGDLQGALDPASEAWNRYNQAVDKATADADLAKKAKGANVEAIDAQKNAIIQLAAQQRDAALDKLSDKAREAYEKLRDSLRSPTDIANGKAIAQIKQLDQWLKDGTISAREYQDALNGVVSQGAKEPPKYEGLDGAVGGAFSELDKIGNKEKELQDWYQKQLDLLNQFREQKFGNEAAWNAREAGLTQQHNDSLAQLEQARSRAMLIGLTGTFASAAEAVKQGFGEQSKAYRLAFGLSKGAAIAQATMNMYLDISQAASKGWPANVPLIAAAVAEGTSILGAIRSITAGSGYSDGGYTGPGGVREPAGVVHRGEVVWSQRDIARAGGVGTVEAMRLGYLGYADGGLVGFADGFQAPASPSIPSAAERPNAPVVNNRMRVYYVQNEDDLMARLAEHPKFEKAVVVHAGQNGKAIQTEWGS